MQVLRSYFNALLGRDEGATMVEYGLLVAFIALVALVGVTLLGISLSDLFGGIADSF